MSCHGHTQMLQAQLAFLTVRSSREYPLCHVAYVLLYVVLVYQRNTARCRCGVRDTGCKPYVPLS